MPTTPAGLLTLEQIKTYLSVKESAYDSLLTDIGTQMSDYFESETGRYFGPSVAVTNEIVTGHGSTTVQVSGNILSLESLDVRWTLNTWTAVDLSLLEFDGNLIMRTDGINFPDIFRSVRVSYHRGYATVPLRVQAAVLEMVAAAFRERIASSSAQAPSAKGDVFTPTVRDTILHYRGIPAGF